MGWAGLTVKNEADPPTIAPAMGAWTISRAINFPLSKMEITNEDIRDAPIDRTMQKGPMKMLK